MAWNPETDSWAPGEPPVGDASVLADTKDTAVPAKGGSTVLPQAPSDFMSDIGARGDQLQRDLVGPAKEAQEKQSYADRQRDERTEKDRRDMQESWNYERAAAGDPALRPWNADQEKANRVRGPMEQFGSVGFIFAMAASAFTRTPMTSALNAGAAAMTAIQQGDEKAYEHAYKAWKDNSDLAIRRFDMEHRLYEDADKLLTTDMDLWKQKTLEIAAQFDDQKKIAMLNAGLDPEVLKAQDAAAKARLDLIKAKEGMEEYEDKRRMISERIKALRKSHPDWKDDNKSPEQTVAEANVYRDVIQAMKGMQPRTVSPNQQQYELIRQEFEGDPDAEGKIADKYAKFVREQKQPGGGAGGSSNLTADRQRAADVAKIMEEQEKAGEFKGKTMKEVADIRSNLEKDLKARATPTSANRRDDLLAQIGRTDRGIEVIDKVEKLLKQHAGMSGLGGKIARPGETFAQILGSNSTAYHEFSSYINMLKEWQKGLLENAKTMGRPLRASEDRANEIIPGLNLGDTSVRVASQLKNVKDLLQQIREEDSKRYEGTATPESSKATTGGGKSGNSWRSIAIPVN